MLRFRSRVGRCPYCHAAVEVSERAACANCLAVHHRECWGEHGACVACGGVQVLLPPGEAAPSAKGAARPPGLTLEEVSQRARLERWQVTRLIARGLLPATYDAGVLRVRPDDLEGFAARRGEALAAIAEDPLPLRAAAERLGLRPRQVRRLVSAGLLRAEDQDGTPYFQPADLEALDLRSEEVVTALKPWLRPRGRRSGGARWPLVTVWLIGTLVLFSALQAAHLETGSWAVVVLSAVVLASLLSIPPTPPGDDAT